MTILPLTYTRDAATCPTFGGRTAEAVGGIGRAKITPPLKGVNGLFLDLSARLPPEGREVRLHPPTVGDAGAPHGVCTEYNLIFIFNF